VPDRNRTVVLIHGLWMTPASWERFTRRYIERGHPVLAPRWPRLRGALADIRRDASVLDGLGIEEIVEHYEGVIRPLSPPPIIIGHCLGGLCVQLLLDRGLGAAGVAIDAPAPSGVRRAPWSQVRSMWPVLRDPRNRIRTVALTFGQFRYAFANGMSEADARTAYAGEAIPGPGRPVFEAAFGGLHRNGATRVDYRNHTRAPLLLVAGEHDHLVPASVTRASHDKYQHAGAVTAFKEFSGRSHLIICQTGWEEVADDTLAWALQQVGS